MKDLVNSVELGVSQRKGERVTRPKVWLKNEFVRVGLAEYLCTYVMMVREFIMKDVWSVVCLDSIFFIIICDFKLTFLIFHLFASLKQQYAID